MRWIVGSWLAVLTLVGAPPPVAAEEQEQLICTAVARVWRGSPEEIADIHTDPVPQSFRAPFESTGCGRFHLVVRSLLDWHFAFGDEQTTSAALAYFSSRWDEEPLAPERYAADLDKAWREAQPRYAEADRLAQANDWQAANELFYKDRKIQALERQIGLGSTRATLMHYYLRGADAYRSPALLAKAEALWPVVEARNAFFDRHAETIATLQRKKPYDPRLELVNAENLLLPYSLANARYRIHDVEFDRDTLRKAALGDWLAGAEQVDDFVWMEIEVESIDETYLTDLAAAIEREPNFMRLPTKLWREDVLYGFARASKTPGDRCKADNFDEAMILLEREERQGRDLAEPLGYWGGYFPEHERDTRLELLLAKAGCDLSHARQARESGEPETENDHLEAALSTLDSARQLVQPDEAPSRFRSVAASYLETAARCRELAATSVDGRPFINCHFAISPRLEAYFRTSLAALDTIATAATAPE